MSTTTSDFGEESGSFRLEILEGLHRGVEITLGEGEYSLGQDTACDIVLSDEGVAKHHTVLRLTYDDASIEAVGGRILVDGLEIASGYGCRLRTPTRLTIGSAVVSLTVPREQKHAPAGQFGDMLRLLHEHPVTAASGIIACAVTAIFVSQLMATPGRRANTSPIVQSAAGNERNVAEIAAGAKKAIERESTAIKAVGNRSLPVANAYEALKKKLGEAGIQSIQLTMGDQTIAAKGRISDAEADKWLTIQRWYDNNFSSAALLNVNVAVGPLPGPAPVRLQAIWFGERPYIIPENGVRYYEGSILETGWVVEKITEERLLLTKNGETFALKYQ